MFYPKQARQFAMIHSIGRAITSMLSLDELLPEISRLIVETLGFYNTEIALVDSDDIVFETCYGGTAKEMFKPGSRQKIGQGITGKAVETGEVILAPDVSQNPDYVHYELLPDVRAELAVPFQVKGKIIGVIDIKSDRKNGLDEDDAAFIKILATWVAIAIENTRLFRDACERSAELETLHQASLHVTSSLELKPVLQAILENTLKLVEADDAHVFLYDGEILSFGAARWRDQAQAEPFAYPRKNGLTYTVARSAERLVVNRIRGHPLFEDSAWDGAIAGFPLRIGEQVVGVMNVAFQVPHIFNENELRVLSLLADQAAIAIRNAELFGATQRRLQELTLLNKVAVSAAEATDENALIAHVTDLISETLYLDSFGVLLMDEAAEALHFHESYHLSKSVQIPATVPLGQGITGKVAQDGHPRRVDDVTLDPDYVAITSEMRSELCVPLKIGETTLGVVNAESRHDLFSEEDERLMLTLANQLATGIEKARLFEETAEALLREQHLNAFARTIGEALDLPELLNNVVRQAAALVGADAGSLRLLASDGYALDRPYFFNLPAVVAENLSPSGVAWHIIITGKSILLPEYRQHPNASSEMIDAGVRAVLAVPVRVGEKIIGALGLFSLDPDIKFTPRDLALTESIGLHIGIAIQNARLFAQEQKRAEELSDALARLQELDRLKNEFIQNVSHEFRTPLGIIRGYSELLNDGILGELRAEQEQPVAIITRRVKMLTQLVEDLMTMMEVEAAQMEEQPTDLVALVNTALADFQVNANQAGLQLTADIAPGEIVITGDALKLRRVLDNLIGNALKFTSQGGTITLRLYDTATDAILEISDTGIGIPEDKLERVFERFYQVDGSMKRRYGGTGLGLALVKEIIQAHKGQVIAQSWPNQGTTFRITLPKREST